MKMERSDGGRWRTQQAGWPILNRIDDLLNVDPAHTTFQPPLLEFSSRSSERAAKG